MEFFYLIIFLVVVAAAIVFRRRVNDPGSSLGSWLERNLHPRMAQAARVVAYLTLAAWILIFLFAPRDESGSVGDIIKSFRTAVGLEKNQEKGADEKQTPSVSPPFRIPGSEETSKTAPGRQ